MTISKNQAVQDWLRQHPQRFRTTSHYISYLTSALSFLVELGNLKGNALFVGDKKEHALIFNKYVKGTPHSFLQCRWVPGLLTNSSQHMGTQQAHKTLAHIVKSRPSSPLRGRALKMFESRETLYEHLNVQIPDVVIFLGSESQLLRIAQECHKVNRPLIACCPTRKYVNHVTYPILQSSSIRNVHFLTKIFVHALTKAQNS